MKTKDVKLFGVFITILILMGIAVDATIVGPDGIWDTDYLNGTTIYAQNIFIGDNNVTASILAGGGSGWDGTGALFQNGTRELTDNWNVGAFNITAPNLQTTEWETSTLSDHEWSGTYIVGTAGENLSIGDLVFINSTGYFKTDANNSATMPGIGLVLETISNSSSGAILIEGVLRDDSWASWTVGGYLFVSWDTGAFSQTPPNVAGSYIQAVGVALSAKIVYFKVDLTIAEPS